MSLTLYVTANSPGEVAGFLVPIVAAARRRMPDLRVAVLLLPCTFATGHEEGVARAIPGVDEVLPVKEFWSLLRGGPAAPAAGVVHLGGDVMYAAMLARRWGVPAWGYQWANRRWDRWMTGYFVKTESDAARLRKQGIAPEKVHVVGDLIVDAVETALASAEPPAIPSGDGPLVAFLPGSRIRHVEVLGPFFLAVASVVRERRPDARFALLVSPFLDWDEVREALEQPPDSKMAGLQGHLAREGDAWEMVGDTGVRMQVAHRDPIAWMASADFVVAIPGTKTGEAGSLGKPMLVLIPSNRAEEIPWFGLVGLLDWIPGVGKHIKGGLLHLMYARKRPLFAQPNILAGRAVVPELVGHLTPEQVGERVLALLDEDEGLQQELLALYRPFQGAADRAMDVVAREVAASGGSVRS